MSVAALASCRPLFIYSVHDHAACCAAVRLVACTPILDGVSNIHGGVPPMGPFGGMRNTGNSTLDLSLLGELSKHVNSGNGLNRLNPLVGVN